MKVLKRTPKTILAQRIIGTKALGIVKPVAERLGFPEKEIDDELTLLAVLSTRMEFDDGELDFRLFSPIDTPEQIAEKFIAYLDSGQLDAIGNAWDLLAEADKPVDAALGPTAPEDKDNNPK
jgi:hypothetical protein